MRSLLLAGLVVTAAAVGVPLGGPAMTAAAAGLVPPANPPANIPSNPAVEGPWSCSSGATGTTCTNPCMHGTGPQLNETPACTDDALRAIDAARAQEGVGPMALPSDWYSLTPAEQLFVVTDLERTARGLPPIAGMAPTLNAAAQAGAAASTDPLPSGSTLPYAAYAAVWAGGEVSPLAADYSWMYDDGWGGPSGTFNLSCTAPGAPGCWGHRDNLLAFPTCTTCVLGAGFAQVGGATATSYAELLVTPAGTAPAPVLSWSAVVPFLADPLTATSTSTVGWRVGSTLPGGYWLVAGDGGIFSFGNAPFYGSTGGMRLNRPVVGMAATADRAGYWLVARDGGVFAFGDARFHGSVPQVAAVDNVVALVPDPATGGYWEVAATGAVYAFDAPYLGNAPSGSPVVGAAATLSGAGYWLVASDGGVFAFGDARFSGSMGGVPLNRPVVGMAAAASGRGYRLVASDGGIFSFGSAAFYGSMGGHALDAPVVGLAATPGGGGYWEVASDGGIFSFGSAAFYGSMGGHALNAPVIAMVGT